MKLEEKIKEVTDKVAAFGLEKIKAVTEKEAVLVVQVIAIVIEYVRHYFRRDVERFETLEVENEITADVVNPKTGRSSLIWDHAAKLDGLALDRYNGKDILIEHKSTVESLEEWSDYWRRLAIDSQVSNYLLTLRQSGRTDVSTVLYDVVAKPGTKPKNVLKSDVRKIAESELYFGFKVSSATLAEIRESYEADKGKSGGYNGTFRENLELYALRLRRSISDNPTIWFRRKTIVRSDEELLQYAGELWELGRELRENRKSQFHPKNTTNCRAFGRTCEFFPLCCGEKSVQEYEMKSFVHSELENTTAKYGGRDLLTNSRLTIFQSCRQRHHYQYDVGLKRPSGSSSVALFWGSLLHEALEIVWKFYKGESLCPTG